MHWWALYNFEKSHAYMHNYCWFWNIIMWIILFVVTALPKKKNKVDSYLWVLKYSQMYLKSSILKFWEGKKCWGTNWNCIELWVYSKKKKNKLENIRCYWKSKMEECNAHNDMAPETDSADPEAHSCHPTDPQAGTSQSPPSKWRNMVSVYLVYYC